MATLTTTVTETLTLNGQSYNSIQSKTIASITQALKTTVTCLNSAETAILGVAAAGSTDLGKSYVAGQFDQDSVRYIRITNLDASNYVLLTIRNSRNSDANEVAIKLDKGASFIYGVDLDAGTEATLTSGTSALSIGAGDTLNNLIDIVGIANGGDCKLEVFVASLDAA
jgi:hypothetical protein